MPHDLVHSGTPEGVPPSFDCAIRKAAYDYGKTLLPSRGGFQSLFDALQLGSCPSHVAGKRPALLDSWSPPEDPLPTNQPVLVVDPHHTGSLSDTHRTVHEAIAASRALRRERRLRAGAPVTVALRGGVHHLGTTLELGAMDSGLTLRSFPGEPAILSGGTPLGPLNWKPSSVCKGGAAGCWAATVADGPAEMRGLRLNNARQIRARYPNFDPERDRVINGSYMVHDGYSGWIRARTNWTAGGTHRMNNIDGWPPSATATTHVINDTHWPGVDWPMHITTNGTVDPSTWTGEGGWGQFWIGVGGTCIDRSPAAGYWCSPGAPRKIATPNHPVGMRPTTSQLPNLPYRDARGAVVHAWRPGHWYTNMYEVGGARPLNGSRAIELNFTRGGFQGGEGVTAGEAWYIENVLEELDLEREWYYNATSRTLYYAPNATTASDTSAASSTPSGLGGASSTPPATGFVATDLEVLVNISGTQAAPARGITIAGLTLRDTAYTYFAPHGLPSGGDWALQRQGAITLHATEGVTLASNLFADLDGNALFVGGYHRNLTIEMNECAPPSLALLSPH